MEKISIIMPSIGRGGPGIKKKIISDIEIENQFLEAGTNRLRSGNL